MRYRFILLLAALPLAACTAPPLEPGSMQPMSDILQQYAPNPALAGNISLGTVTAPPELAESGIASVTDQVVREALSSALLSAGYLKRGGENGNYILNAQMTELDMPSMGFDMTTPSTVQYSLVHRPSGQTVYQETIRQEYTADWSDAFNANQRVRLSAANSMRENITHLIRVLNDLPLHQSAPITAHTSPSATAITPVAIPNGNAASPWGR